MVVVLLHMLRIRPRILIVWFRTQNIWVMRRGYWWCPGLISLLFYSMAILLIFISHVSVQYSGTTSDNRHFRNGLILYRKHQLIFYDAVVLRIGVTLLRDKKVCNIGPLIRRQSSPGYACGDSRPHNCLRLTNSL